MEERKFNWSANLISGLLIFVLSVAVSYGLSMGYSFYVAFVTRGDMKIIQQKAAEFSTSPLFIGAMIVTLGAVAAWRGKKIAGSAPEAPVLNALIAMLLGITTRVAIGMMVWPPSNLDTYIPRTLGETAVVVAAGCLSAYLAHAKAQPV